MTYRCEHEDCTRRAAGFQWSPYLERYLRLCLIHLCEQVLTTWD